MKVSFTKKNIQRMLKHRPTQLKHTQIGSGIQVHPDMPQRVMEALHRAMRQQKGVRIQILPTDIQAGSGFWDWLKGAARTVYNTVGRPLVSAVQTFAKPVLQVARPLVRQFAPEIAAAASTFTGLPISKEQVLGAEELSKKVLGVGVKRTKGGAMKKAVMPPIPKPTAMIPPIPKPTAIGLQDNYSTLMAPNHPIFHTNFQLPDHSIAPALRLATTGSMVGRGVIIPQSSDYMGVNPVKVKPDYTLGGSMKRKIVMPRGKGFKVAGY